MTDVSFCDGPIICMFIAFLFAPAGIFMFKKLVSS